MSVTFSTGFHTLKPGYRVSGDEISVVFVDTYDSGIYAGKKYIHIDLTNETDLTFVEAGVSGPLETVVDVDALYTQLKDAGMTEAFDGFLVDPSDLSSIQIANQQISFDFAGHQPYIFSRNPDASVTDRSKVAHQTWSLPQGAFAAAVTLFTTVESPEEIEFQSIEDRFALEDAQLDALIASGMWLFPDQAAFPPAVDNHGRVVHSHADGAIFFAHAGTWHQVASEADLQAAITALEAADTALGGRLDTLEADPTTAAAVAAGDAATLSSANTYTDGKIADVVGAAPGILDTLQEIASAINDDGNVYTTLVAQIDAVQADVGANQTSSDAAESALSGRIDVLEVDPTTATAVAAVQSDVDANETASDAADAALSGRLDTLETDPTTATALAAVQSDVDANEVDSDAADAALSGRLDVLEADPTTQSLLSAEETARIAGDAALREELFPPECAYQEITAQLVARDSAGASTPSGGNGTNTDTDLGWEDSATFTNRLWVPNSLRGSGSDRFPYGDGTLPPHSKITINGERYDVTVYTNTSGYSYFAVTADLASLVGTEITLSWCIPDVYAPIEAPDFTGQVDIDTNARIEFADNLTKIHNVLRGTSINIGNNIELKPAAAGGRVEITGDLIIDASDFTDAADDTAAAAAGVVVGQVYRTGSVLKVRVS